MTNPKPGTDADAAREQAAQQAAQQTQEIADRYKLGDAGILAGIPPELMEEHAAALAERLGTLNPEPPRVPGLPASPNAGLLGHIPPPNYLAGMERALGRRPAKPEPVEHSPQPSANAHIVDRMNRGLGRHQKRNH